MNKRTLSILFATALACASVAAQNQYDDLYYSPSKAAKEKQKKEEQLRQLQAEAYRNQAAQFNDSYSTGSSMPLTVDVDAYNRRTDSETYPGNSTSDEGDFSYTRRLERFHNPEIVAQSGDDELIEYYYSAASQPEVNIYVIDNNPFSWGWNRPYYSWRYNYGWPSWNYGWPSWNYGWGFDPWCDVSFGWGSPWYGPSWGWNWGWSWGWNHPGWAPRPPMAGHPGHPGHPGGLRPGNGWAVNSPGASRPHRPASGASTTAGRRPSYGGTVNSWNSYNQANTRPGNMGNSSTRPSSGSGVQGSSRPSNPSHNQGTSTSPSNNSRRSSGSGYNNSSSGRTSSPSYSRPSTGGSRNYGGGSRSGGGGAGGAGRGRR